MFNAKVIMSGADYMSNQSPINAYMHNEPFDTKLAIKQHLAIKKELQAIGIKVIQVPPPSGCQDGIFTANWGLIKGRVALISSLPTVRKAEEKYAKHVLEALGLKVYKTPAHVKFSGQGDALPCGEYVFVGTGYRTDKKAHKLIEEKLGYKVIAVKAVPKLDENNKPVINSETGWPDSYFYDLDLAIAIIYPPSENGKGLIAWCRDALVKDSQAIIDKLDFVDKIEVPYEEATKFSACNLVSNGEHVVMNAGAKNLQQQLEERGIKVTTLHNEELAKNGGSVRCATLTLA